MDDIGVRCCWEVRILEKGECRRRHGKLSLAEKSGPRLADRCSQYIIRPTRPRGLRFKRGPKLFAACGVHGSGTVLVAGAPSPSHTLSHAHLFGYRRELQLASTSRSNCDFAVNALRARVGSESRLKVVRRPRPLFIPSLLAGRTRACTGMSESSRSARRSKFRPNLKKHATLPVAHTHAVTLW